MTTITTEPAAQPGGDPTPAWHLVHGTGDGKIGRVAYASIGVTLFIVKHLLDRAIAFYGFHRDWWLTSYFVPGQSIWELGPKDLHFFEVLLAVALPFIWVGVVLTVQRLRSAGLRPTLAVLFFVPVVNLFFFTLLSLVPEAQNEGLVPESREHWLQRFLPESELAAAAMAVVMIVPPALAVTYISVGRLGQYGAGLFVGLPFAIGLASSLLYCTHRRRSFWKCQSVAATAVTVLGAVLLALAFEGVFCMLMAAPLAYGLAFLGASIGYLVAGSSARNASMLLACCLAAPALVGADYENPEPSPLLTVVSSVEIAAPPARVWDSVVAFTHIPEPTEWLFRAGVAYPIQATIHGRGPGAVRQCMFSTGSFVEPIEVWDEPHLLRFSVRSNPAPMQEWTPYGNIYPAHLDGYLRSEGGQFRLKALANGHTRLEGTTWYHHGLWPASYWQLWSDQIIHQIHLRVLNHIKRTVEA